MKKKTAIWIKIIVLGILTLALIGILIVGILGNTFRNFPIFGSFSSYDNADLYQVGNADISASELSSLSIDWVSGSVKVDVYDGNVIQIREDGASDLSDSDKAHYYYRSLASNLSEISGDVVSADTTINGLSTKNFYLDTVSGNLTFNGSAERIDSDIVSGDCRITSSVTPQKIDMESVSGDISVSIPGNSEFEAENDSVSGDLTCSFAGTKKDDKFVCGSGINRYDFDTVSGDVEILPVG